MKGEPYMNGYKRVSIHLEAVVLCLFVFWGAMFPVNGVAEADNDPFVGTIVDGERLRGIEDVYIGDGYMYLPCREGKRLTICSLDEPQNPRIISSFTHPELAQASGCAIDGDRVYLASLNNQRLLVIDASDKRALRLLGSVQLGRSSDGIIYKVAYQNGHCYVAHQSEKRLYVVDVRNPSRPSVVGSVAVTDDNDGPFSVVLNGDYAYVGTIFGSRNRLAVVDIRIPEKPRLVTAILGPDIGHASGEIVGNMYYAVNWDKNAFLVFDVSTPASPKLVATLVDPRLGKPNRCVVKGNRAYLPMVEGSGVAAVDISDPKNPAFLATLQHPIMEKTYGVAVLDGLLYIGAREGNSLVILDPRKLEP